ncbi:hypothetical protein LZZ85_02275 [Terrimonas sp. NA20]|uniref:Uncharacterized protein n=1 Tax=Terrimonas ginsenosidimutans TaxID=2908004 RepID=A0ABS9KLD9_9BACT|nr:hypothetical protein [Terrimonas ginsenosidimutans]MCG2613080.1 hypothetical protein [Terrimonas ginsenosidimutans]
MKKLLILILMFSLVSGCKKSTEIKCEGLVAALEMENLEMMKQLVSELGADQDPKETDTDRDGHYNSYLEVIRRLKNCGLEVAGICYGCIQTLPAMSEIRISVNNGSGSITRIIDLSRDDSGRFVCKNMHR